MRPRASETVLMVIMMLICTYPVYAAMSEMPVGVEETVEKPFLPAGYPEHGIWINIPARKLVIVDQGRVVGAYSVAVGRSDSPSPVGDFTVETRIWQPWWYPRGREPVPAGPENPLGPWWLGLDLKGYGIHGNNNESSIGQFISEGCIRMSNPDIFEVARWARIGTAVRLVYDTVSLIPHLKEGDVEWRVAVHRDAYGLTEGSEQDLGLQLHELVRENSLSLSGVDEVLVLKSLAGADLPVEVPVLAPAADRARSEETESLAVIFGDQVLQAGALMAGGEVHLPLGAFLSEMGRLRGTSFVVEFDFRPDHWHRVGPDGLIDVELGLQGQWPPSFNVNIAGRNTGEYEGLTAFYWEDLVYVPAEEISERFRVTVRADGHAARISWRELYLRFHLLAVYEDSQDVGPSMIPADVIREVFGRRITWDEQEQEADFMGRNLEQVIWQDLGWPWVCLEEIVEVLGLKLQMEDGKLRMVS